MSISCNATGDIIALIDIGVTVCKIIVSTKHAKTEYKRVLADLKSLRPILQQLDRILCTLGDREREELIQLIDSAKSDIGEALDHLIKHDGLDTQGNNLPAHARIRAGWDALRWALGGRKDVEEGMARLSKTLGFLHFALGVVHWGNSNAQTQRLEDGQSQLLAGIGDIRAGTIHIQQQQQNLAQDIRDSSADILDEIATSSRIMCYSFNEIAQQGLARDRRVEDMERLYYMRKSKERQWFEKRMDAADAQLRAILQSTQHRRTSFITEIWQFIPDRHRLVIVAAAFASDSRQFPSSHLMSGCIGSLLTLAASAPSGGERVGYVICALSVLLVMGFAKMYKAPKVEHVIIIIDFFGHDFELPLDDATSSTSLHEALERHFENKRGINLTRARMYELALSDGLPKVTHAVTWDVPLKPGQKLLMSARVHDMNGQCPACETLCSPGCSPPDGWITCTNLKCRARFNFKSPIAEDGIEDSKMSGSPQLAHAAADFERRGLTTPSTRADITVPPAPTPALPQQAILEEIGHCRRIRVLVLDQATSACVDAKEKIEVEVADEVDDQVDGQVDGQVKAQKSEAEVDDKVKGDVEGEAEAGADDKVPEPMSSPQYTLVPGAARMGTMPMPPLTPQTHLSGGPYGTYQTRSSPYYFQPLAPISPARSLPLGSVAPSQYFNQCVWDVTQSPDEACTPDRQPFAPFLAQRGTDSPVPQVTLYLHIGLRAPQAVVVNAADHRAVTINDILAHIHADLHNAIGQALWNNLSPQKKQRVAASTGHQQPRMLHLLEGATRLSSVRTSQVLNSFDILFSR